MSKHLSECFASLCECDDTHFKSTDCDFNCICPSLRACEQRVRQEIDREAFVLDEGDPYREAYRAGYSKGVRDAHESASWCQDPDEMLQAIIGLLNMPPPPPLPPSVGVPEKWRP